LPSRGKGKGKVFEETTNMHIHTFNHSNDAERAGAIKRDTTVLALMTGVEGTE
jgi:hypothetical protein